MFRTQKCTTPAPLQTDEAAQSQMIRMGTRAMSARTQSSLGALRVWKQRGGKRAHLQERRLRLRSASTMAALLQRGAASGAGRYATLRLSAARGGGRRALSVNALAKGAGAARKRSRPADAFTADALDDLTSPIVLISPVREDHSAYIKDVAGAEPSPQVSVTDAQSVVLCAALISHFRRFHSHFAATAPASRARG